MQKMKTEKNYRVFVNRHYIAVEWFDIKAKSTIQAIRKAESTARKLYKDVREIAVDNDWQAEEPVEIDEIGSHAHGIYQMDEVSKNVFHTRENK